MQLGHVERVGRAVSRLGFGAMRLPGEAWGKVDFDEAVPLIRRSLELGVNLIDSHHFYHEGDSETAVGRAIAGWKREDLILSTKVPCYRDPSGEQWQEWFDTALDKLGTDYIDLYLAHSFSKDSFDRDHERFLRFASEKKDEGAVRHIGFSFHDSAEVLKEILDTDAFDCMLVQYNLLNRSLEEMLSYAKHEKGMLVMVMGPVGGGSLGDPSSVIGGLLGSEPHSGAETALRFVLGNPDVDVALSGMSTLAQLEENAVVASRDTILTQDERERIEQRLAELSELKKLYCTGCGYCMPCEHGVNIPRNFDAMNLHRVYGLTEKARQQYTRLKEAQAAHCRECGACEPKCPQNIEIRKQLKDVADTLG